MTAKIEMHNSLKTHQLNRFFDFSAKKMLATKKEIRYDSSRS